MAQQPIEMILGRQFADHVATPMIIFDSQGTAVFWNEPAEEFTGVRYDEAGRISKEAWMRGYRGRDAAGHEIPLAELPPVVALEQRRPAHLSHRARLFGEAWYDVDVSALPIVGQQNRFLGILVFFWATRLDLGLHDDPDATSDLAPGAIPVKVSSDER